MTFIKDLYENRYEPDKLVILIEREYKNSLSVVASSNSLQQLKAEIAALVQEHFLVSDCGVSYGHIGVFITKLRQLTAV